MPYQRHTTRHLHDIKVEYDKELVDKAVKHKWHVYENRPLTTGAELWRVVKRVVYSDATRLTAVRSLIQEHPKLIVFYNYDFELEILRKLGETGAPSQKTEPSSSSTSNAKGTGANSVAMAEWNGHKHEEIPKTDSWVYLVQYVAGAEAWETTETDAMVFYSLPHSYKNWHQSFGRIDRITTKFKDLHYYTLFAGTYYERSIRNSLRAKRSFNESAFSKVTVPEITYSA